MIESYYVDSFKKRVLFLLSRTLNRGKLFDADSKRFLFILSAGRSGSTLLRSKLMSTGEVFIPPESGSLISELSVEFVKQSLQGKVFTLARLKSVLEGIGDLKNWKVGGSDFEFTLTDLELSNLTRMISAIYHAEAQATGAEGFRYLGDKTPFLSIDLRWVRMLFPNSKFIHLVRDPRAVIASRMKHFDEDLHQAVWRWKRSSQEIMTLAKDKVLTVRYEDLIKDTKSTLHKITEYLEIEGKFDLFEFDLGDVESARHHNSFSREIDISRTSPWKDELCIKDVKEIEILLKEEMELYQYGSS